MEFPFNFLRIYNQSKEYLNDDELASSIELLNQTIQNSDQDAKTKATINGIHQSYNVNELAYSRKLVSKEKRLKNRDMLKEKTQNLTDKLYVRYIWWRWKGIILAVFGAIIIFFIVSNVFLNIDFDTDQNKLFNDPDEFEIGDINDIFRSGLTRHKYPPSVIFDDWEMSRNKNDQSLNFIPLKKVKKPDSEIESIPFLYNQDGSSKEYGICVSSFKHQENAENFMELHPTFVIQFSFASQSYRVFESVSSNLDFLKKRLKNIKKSYSEAWIVSIEKEDNRMYASKGDF